METLADMVQAAWLGRAVLALSDAHSCAILSGATSDVVPTDALRAGRDSLRALSDAWGVDLNHFRLGPMAEVSLSWG